MKSYVIIPLFVLACSSAWGAAKSNRPGAAAVSATPVSTMAPSERIWVGKSDSAQSCNVNSGISVDKMGADLSKAGIKYTEHRKLADDKMHIQMCGADKGTMNVYSISKEDLPKALSLGFAEVKLQQ